MQQSIIDQLPKVLVIGGTRADSAEVQSRMLGAGWMVKDHWLNGEAHSYERLPAGVTLVVVLHELMEHKNYTRACTMADVGRVPIVKWDVNRHKFRQRLEQKGLLHEVPQLAPPEPAPPMEAAVPETHNGVEQGPLPEPAQTTAADFMSLCELMRQELSTHPLFSGVAIQVMDDGTAQVTPTARVVRLGGAGQRPPEAHQRTEDVTHALIEAIRSLTTELRAVGAAPQPAPPQPRPVEMPCPPRIENPAPSVQPTRNGPHRFKKGQKLNMDCRFPGCKAKGMGPRFQWHCRAHQGLSMKQKHANMDQWKQEHNTFR